MSMEKQARYGDKVKITCPHGIQIGIIKSGSSYSFSDSKKIARLTDVVICTTCGAKGHIITGSPYTFQDSLATARVTDKCVGTCSWGCKHCPHSRTGVIIEGSNYKHAG